MPITNANVVEYALISQSRGRVVIPEPINFEDGNGNIYERDKDSKGFLKTKSNDLEFYGDAYSFFSNQYYTKGIAEDVILQRRLKDEKRLDERWKTVSETFQDMRELDFDEDRNTVTTKATQGGIYKEVESALSDEFDLVSTTSKTGVEIGVLNTVNVPLEPRDIFLRSEAEVPEGLQVTATVSGGDNLNARCFRYQFDINSDGDNITSVIGDDLNANNGDYADLSSGNSGNCFITNAKTNKIVRLNGFARAEIISGESGTVELDIVYYEQGSDLVYNNKKINLDSDNTNLGSVVEFTFNDYEISVAEGESVTIGLLSNTADGIQYAISGSLVVEEDSGENLPITNARAITEFEAADRLLAKITGRTGVLRSDLLSTTTRTLTQGFWIRQFPDIVNEGTDEERKIQFVTSFSDFLDHIEATLEPVAWWVEKEGQEEYVRIENLKYTQQNFIGIRYRIDGNFIEASKVKRKVLKDNFYSKIEIGSEKGGDGYEEVFGLQSVCGMATFSTINTSNDVTYTKLSPYRLGDIDAELPRRKQFSDFPEEDTKYDSDIICLDTVLQNNSYRLKKWQDSYEIAPTGIYRVESAYNLEFTPARLLLKHGFQINVGLYHYPNESIRFLSSNCNSSFSSKKVGEDILNEDGDIPHSILESPRIRPSSVDFNLEVDLDLEEEITGETNGIPNWFGLVAVKTGVDIEYMRLVKVDTNNEGTHKLVEAFI